MVMQVRKFCNCELKTRMNCNKSTCGTIKMLLVNVEEVEKSGNVHSRYNLLSTLILIM